MMNTINKDTKDLYIRIINQAEDYIEQHLTEKISLDDVANYIGLSSFHFHKIFKLYSQETLNEFILRHKIERSAIYLLTNPSVSITDVSYSYGFNDSSAYSRAFKRHYGLSPSGFRKSQEMTSKIK